jgi:acyl-CoA synthetase (AMP-forming)/AMP-acid ligase II
VDDVINVSGHRIGTAEVEGALTQHEQCAEAAVVPMEHPIKGQGIYAFVTLMQARACAAPPAPVFFRFCTCLSHDFKRRHAARGGPAPCMPHLELLTASM